MFLFWCIFFWNRKFKWNFFFKATKLFSWGLWNSLHIFLHVAENVEKVCRFHFLHPLISKYLSYLSDLLSVFPFVSAESKPTNGKDGERRVNAIAIWLQTLNISDGQAALSLWKSHIYLSVLEKCREHDVMVSRALRATAEWRLYENQLWGGGETELKLSVTCSAQIRDTSRTEKHSIRRDFITALHSKHKTIKFCHHVFMFFFFCGTQKHAFFAITRWTEVICNTFISLF